jgi:S1-C subfamily serine protease
MDQRYEFIPMDNSSNDPVHINSANILDDIDRTTTVVATFDGNRPAQSSNTQSGNSRPMSLLGRWLWLMTMICVILSMRLWVPGFVEEIQFSLARGKLRAEHESATEVLATAPLEGISHAYRSVSRKIAPSLVHISVESPTDLPEEFSFLENRRMLHKGQGSGVIVDDDGYIMTNYHVIKDAAAVEVTLADGRIVAGQMVGFDELTDLAVLKIDAPKLVAAEWGDSDELDVGSPVWAAGSPFGLQRSVTFGILSAKNRAGLAGTPYQDFLQTDAAVNPGNSGGPLVNTRGNVIGINTAIVGEAYQGISFAVPSSVVQKVYARIKKGGHVSRGWLGVLMAEVDEQLADRMGLPDTEGVFIEQVVGKPDSPAARAGLQARDIIRAWNGQKIINRSTLARIVAKTQIGSEATVKVLRDNEELLFKIQVGERPETL